MSGLGDLLLIEWQRPWAGLLALLPLLTLWLGVQRHKRINAWAEPKLRPWATHPVSAPGGIRLRTLCEALGWMLLAIALAGPRTPGQVLSEDDDHRRRAALHVSVLVQTSTGMGETDLRPTRLERARLAMHDLLGRHAGESLSLIVWGVQPGLLLPATHDPSLFADALRWLGADLVPSGGARLDRALSLALQQPLPATAAHHAIVLVTDADAEALRGEQLAVTLAELRARDITLFVLLASPRDAASRSTAFGRGELDPDAFDTLAQQHGGTLTALDAHDNGLAALYDRGLARISLPPPAPEALRHWQSRHPWPLAAGLLLLLLAYSPRPELRRHGASALVLLLALVPALLPTSARADDPRSRAWQAFEHGQWETATRLYASIGGHEGHHGAGVAALHADRPADALTHLELAWMLAPDEASRHDALYDLGHAHAALGRWDTALQAWLAVLASRPDDPAAERNAEIARSELLRHSLADDRAQDLYALRGVLAEGHISPEGTRDDEPPPSSADASGAAGSVASAAAEPTRQEANYLPDPGQLESGRVKVERLVEDRLRLRRALLEQDRNARLPETGTP